MKKIEPWVITLVMAADAKVMIVGAIYPVPTALIVDTVIYKSEDLGYNNPLKDRMEAQALAASKDQYPASSEGMSSIFQALLVQQHQGVGYAIALAGLVENIQSAFDKKLTEITQNAEKKNAVRVVPGAVDEMRSRLPFNDGGGNFGGPANGFGGFGGGGDITIMTPDITGPDGSMYGESFTLYSGGGGGSPWGNPIGEEELR